MNWNKWVGKKVLTMYDNYCTVVAANCRDAVVTLSCLEDRTNKIFFFHEEDISLITKDNELLDTQAAEIYGKYVDGKVDLYERLNCKQLNIEEVEKEFDRV